MNPLRQLGSILRGRATRLQVLLACVLGGVLGFVPGFFLFEDLGGGFAQAPGLIALLLCVALIANANLAVFVTATVLAKLLSMPLLSLSFTIGTWLVDGPLQGLFHWLCNSQVSAWFGLEYYATTGGLVLGLAFGVLCGWLCNRVLRAIRQRMAEAERSSERYQQLAGKWWVKIVSWAFLGRGKNRKTWQEVAEQTGKGLPIRILGVIAAVLLCASVFTFQQWFSTPLLTENLQATLAAGNGATVDLSQAALHLSDGEVRVSGLALTDRGDLGRNLFAADELVLSIDMAELLRRRFVIDEVRAVNATAGTQRQTPGVLLPGAEVEPVPAPEGVPTIEDYLEQYELWQQRLEQAREWVEVVFPEGDDTGEPPTAEEVEAEQQQQIERFGLAGVMASHLFAEGPRVLIRKIDIEGISWTHAGGTEQLALRLRNVSSDPSLTAEPPSVSLANANETFALGFGGAPAGGSGVGMTLTCRELAIDSLFSGIRIGGESPLRGGTFDFDCRGALSWSAGKAMAIDLPLRATLRDTTLNLGKAGSTAIEQLALPVGLRGDATRPSVYFEASALRDALLQAGKQELARLVQDQGAKLLQGLGAKVPDELQGIVDPSKTPQEMLDAAKAKAAAALEAEKKKAQAELEQRAKKEAEKLLPGLGGILGGKKKKD